MSQNPSILDSFSNIPVHFAPMVGLSHYAVREALSEFLPSGARSLWPTEMLSSRRIPHQKPNQVPEIFFYDSQRGLCPQLLGNQEEEIRRSVVKLEEWGASAIDINMGCPVQQALKHNYGVSLMGDPSYAAKVVEMTVKAAQVPVSVKLRAGLQKDPEYLVKFCRGLEEAGASWITLHPRTADEGRRGRSDWSQIRLLKSELRIPVIGNGDVQCLDDIKSMRAETGCDRVMVGRALLGKPYLLSQIADEMGFEVEAWALPEGPEEEAQVYGGFLKKVLELSRIHYPEIWGLRKFGFLVYHSSAWLEFGHHLYARVRSARSYAEVYGALQCFFELSHRQRLRSELRK